MVLVPLMLPIIVSLGVPPPIIRRLGRMAPNAKGLEITEHMVAAASEGKNVIH